jgi:uncharacterized protein YciI
MTDDYVSTAIKLTAGMLGKSLWVVITKAVVEREKMLPFLEAHLAHQVRLEKEGIMFAAGPLQNEDGSRAETGLIVIRAADAADARRIADSDPMHKNGVRAYTLYQWTVNEGRMTMSFDFSDQSAKFA